MRLRLGLALSGLMFGGVVLAAQAASPALGTTYRVFLKDGQSLASYGEAATVGDRLVFNLIIRAADTPDLQLMSLPLASVDVDRTKAYADAKHAAYYAATRGETEYAAMTTDVSKALAQLRATTDKAQRLNFALAARKQLRDWSVSHFGYRDSDVQELTKLFDEVISELRIANGESNFAFDLVAGVSAKPRESLLPDPTSRDLIGSALHAAEIADSTEERIAVLRATSAAASGDASATDLASAAALRLGYELRTEAAYTALAADISQRADAAVRTGDAAAIQRLRAEVTERSQQLGGRRPQRIDALLQELQTKLAAAETRRLALDHYAGMRPVLLQYERRVRPAMIGLDGLSPVLRYLRDAHYMSYERVVSAETRLRRLETDLAAVTPPEDFAGVHATIVSALRMAREAAFRRRQAMVTYVARTEGEASAAASGALLLYDRAHADLVAGLYPPKPQ